MFPNFTVLGFPCNQFGKQEPGANGDEIYNGIKHVRPGNNFEPNFPIFKKIDINGENEHPIFAYLKSACPSTRNFFSDSGKLFYKPLKVNDVRWNFEKFLVSKSGKPYMRYDAATKPSEIESDIQFLLMEDFDWLQNHSHDGYDVVHSIFN